MDPNIWGPVAWNYLHFLSISYPDKPTKIDIDNNKKFLRIFADILPCIKCREHFKSYIQSKDLDIELDSKQKYMKLVWNLHNNVNEFLAKDKIEFSVFLRLYQDIIDSGKFNPIDIKKENTMLRRILYLVLIITFCIILYQIIY